MLIGGALIKYRCDMTRVNARARLDHWYDLRDKRAGQLEAMIGSAHREFERASGYERQRQEDRFYDRLEALVKLCRERTIMLEEEAGENRQGGSHE